MAFSSRQLEYAGPSGKLTAKGAEYTKRYRYVMTDANDGPVTIFNHLKTAGPYFGSYYENGNDTDLTSFVDSIDAPQHVTGSPLHWTVDIHYKPRTTDSKTKPDINGDPTTLPWSWRPEIWTSFATYQGPVETAVYLGGFTHNPVLVNVNDEVVPMNSAIEAFDPPMEKDKSRQVIRIRSWCTYFSLDEVRKYIDTINSVKLGTLPGLVTIVNGTAFGVYGTWDKYTLKVHNIQESPKRDSFEVAGTRYTVDYFEVEVELHWRRDGWREAVSDRGISRHVFPGGPDGRGGTFSQTDFPAGVPGVAAILDANLQPIAHPVPLDGAGQPLAAGQPHKFITYGLYPEIDPTYSPHISCALEKR